MSALVANCCPGNGKRLYGSGSEPYGQGLLVRVPRARPNHRSPREDAKVPHPQRLRLTYLAAIRDGGGLAGKTTSPAYAAKGGRLDLSTTTADPDLPVPVLSTRTRLLR